MFFGTLSKYKNIEILIKIFQDLDDKRIKLMIVGGTDSRDYKNQLYKQISESKSIITDFRFIPETEVVNFYNTADIIILPYNDETVLNSGAMYLSFSLKKTVICPEIGSINALKDKSFIYSYTYTDAIDHTKKLRECIKTVLYDIRNDTNILKKKGKKAFEYVREYHSDEKVAAIYKELYQQLLR